MDSAADFSAEAAAVEALALEAAAGPGGRVGPRASAGPGGAGAPGGAFGGGGFARGRFRRGGADGDPAQPPVVLSRDGKDYSVTGETNVVAGSEFKVTTEGPSLSLSVKELDRGSWVMFELPGFTTAASGTRRAAWMHLAKASATSYYKGNGSLLVKLVSSGDVLGTGPDSGPSGVASLQVSR